MSTKTNFKRVALVAVAALGLGVLTSVAPASAYSGVSYASGTAGGLLTVASGSTAICTAAAYDGTALALGADTGGSDSADLVSITMPVGGIVKMKAAKAADIVYSSGVVLLEDLTDSTVSDGGTKFTSAGDEDVFTIKATAVGTGTVKNYGATAAALSTISVTVVASCGVSTVSSSYTLYETSSADQYAKSLVPTNGGADSSPDGEVGSYYTFADTDEAVISLVVKNAYDTAVPTGTFVVSATNGAFVSIGSSSAAPGATSSASASIAGTNVYAQVSQPVDGVAATTTVTITYGSQTVYSKTLTFQGDLATLTVSGVDVQALGGASINAIYDVVAKDAAGNLLIWSVSGESAKYNALVTNVTGGYTTMTGTGRLDATNDNTDDTAVGSWTCGSKSGSTPMRLKATTNAGTTVYSNEFQAACGSAAYTYTASLDKASYVPGDIATLTITAKDASGFAPFKGETVNADSSAAPSIAGSQMTAVNTPVAADTFDATGVKKYTFTVGSTAGKYNMAVNLGYTGNSAVSVAYSVASDGSVSNADVLKAIVSLIASINKQIAALQKALLKK